MKFIYPAVFRKNEEGGYNAWFPDLDCCYAKGDTLDDAIDNANYAANEWISSELAEEDCELPPVSDASDLELEEGDIVRNISVNIRLYDGWDE
ncbi:MAG: type II toxin-antitoxin system HicB family antitoxin [Blautia sp.]|nr:type II toxin-antitoxin system HicB family antitoxin [Blautia sp.]MDY5031180.1 type II toxin-antitoxin system HicB family antitoxin [Blautia sp.]